MKNIAIKGHTTRGREVIEILEMLGGKNQHNYTVDSESFCFYNNFNGIITYDWTYSCCEDEDVIVFTLEEFLEKYPYKVGDMVRVPEYESGVCIDGMRWNGDEIQYSVSADETESLYEWYSVEELNKCNELHKEKIDVNDNKILLNMSAIDYNNGLVGYEIPAGYEFDTVIDNKVILKKLKSQYPKTFIEVLDFWNPDRQIEDDYQRCYKKDLIEKFQDLLYARDAYWKIAGEEMGLGKPWEPDWKDESKSRYVICMMNNEVSRHISRHISTHIHFVLAFPTEEMRDTFFENFKELIEECKELL